jgi:hypothetical protein
MPTYAVTIAGASKNIREGWTLRETVNGRNTLSFEVTSLDGSYRPALGAEVIITENGTRIFGGNIDQPSERGRAGHGGTAVITSCSAVDFNALPDRRVLTDVLGTRTLKAALQYAVLFLADYGVTLDAGQVTGPTLPTITFGYSRLDELLNQFSVLSGGYVWEVDYNKVLRMFLPGSTGAPFSIVDGDGNATGEITIEPSRVNYANTVYVLGGGDLPYVATATDGGPASALVEAIVRYSDVLDPATLDALAPQELARRLLQPRTARYTTRRTGLKPGMTQTLTVPSHSISSVSFMITEIETRAITYNQVERTVTLVEGSLNAGDWRDVYKGWSGGGSGTGTVLVGSGGAAAAVGIAFLGGSRNTSVALAPAAWTPVVDFVAFTARASFSGLVRADAWAREAGTSVQLRLRNVTDSTTAASSAIVTSQTPTAVTFSVSITAGKTYRLEMQSSASGSGVFGIGALESA